MLLGIVIPLKAKSVSRNWERDCMLLRQTLNSTLGQTNSCYEVMVCGHDKPDFLGRQDYSKIRFTTFTDAPPPTGDTSNRDTHRLYEFDRCNKIHRGIEALIKTKTQITHWFALDADDLIRRDFVEQVYKHRHRDAIIIDHGYKFDVIESIVSTQNDFSQWCGSSSVISADIFDTPASLATPDCYQVPFRKYGHACMKSKLVEDGYDVAVAQERLVMYRVNHGGNLSDGSWHNGIKYRFKESVKSLMSLRRLKQINGSERDRISASFSIDL